MSEKTGRSQSRNLREDCVAEGLRIVSEKGVEALSLREVARRLGVSHQAPYKHFASRDHILAEMVRQSYASFAQFLEQRPITNNAPDDLGAMGKAYLEYAFAHPLQYRLMFGTPLPPPENHPAMMEEARHAFGLLQKGIADVHAMRADPQAEARTDFDAFFVWSALHGLAAIMQSSVLNTLDLAPGSVDRMPEETLNRIGWMLGLDDPSECAS
ncbi:MAG: TetR/AcrR family transcriptional regulator [Pseudomonadota bacterium]